MRIETNTLVDEWDMLAERFNTHRIKEEVHPDAAVNIHVGWPVFFQQIEFQAAFLGNRSLEILDFGCGTGGYCIELDKRGHKVSGMDQSNRMVELSTLKVPSDVKLYYREEFWKTVSSGKLDARFDIISSMHVFDWIEDINTTLTGLSRIVKKDGLIMFAVFTKDHIIDSLKIKDLFEDFDSTDNPTSGYANFDGIKVPVFVKDAGYYDSFFHSIGFDKVLEFYPPYTYKFLKDYHWTGSLRPEMQILAYRKR
jgi:SAM-dependent methyltransferase